MPHGQVGAGVGDFAFGVGGDPVALFGCDRVGSGDLHGVGDALVAEGCFRRVEVQLEELEVGSARGDEAAVAYDSDEIFGERVSYTEQIATLDGLVGEDAGCAYLGFVVSV